MSARTPNYEGLEITAYVPSPDDPWWGTGGEAGDGWPMDCVLAQAEQIAEALAEFLEERYPGAEVEVEVGRLGEPTPGRSIGTDDENLALAVDLDIDRWWGEARWEQASRAGQMVYYRRRTGLSQAEFAARVCVSENSIARIERREMGVRPPVLELARREAARVDAARTAVPVTISYDVPDSDSYYTDDADEARQVPTLVANIRALGRHKP